MLENPKYTWIIRSLPATGFGAWFAYLLHTSFYFEFPGFGILMYIVGALYLLLSIGNFGLDLGAFKRTRSYRSFVPSVLSLLIGLVCLIVYLPLKKQLDTPSLVVAHSIGGFGGIRLELKEDGTFILLDGGIGVTREFGTYHLSDSLIIFDKKGTHSLLSEKAYYVKYNPSRIEYPYQLVPLGRKAREYIAVVKDLR